MPRNKHQSNNREWCPVCARPLDNRAAATSHYKRHVREGRLESRPGEYNIQQWANVTEYRLTYSVDHPGRWFERGFNTLGIFRPGEDKVAVAWKRWLVARGLETYWQSLVKHGHVEEVD